MQKNERFIINREILPKGKQGGVDWFNSKEIEVYFVDDEKTYTLKIEDVIRDKYRTIKVLLSYNSNSYKKHLQVGQILNGNLEIVFNYFGMRGNKLRPFRLSKDCTYWIGTTDKSEEFYFNGEYSEEIMKYNWYVSNGYLVTKKNSEANQVNIRLNRLVLGITDRNIVVNHCGGNVMDNRVEMLSLSDHEDNMKELLPSIYNNTGITGLMLNEGNNKYNISCAINGFSYNSTYKTKEEALIDLLIIQRHYGYRHNDNLYYMLDSINEEYTNQLIEKVKNKIGTYKVNPVICKNRFELSEDKTFYWMYDKKNNKCKISIEDIELVEQGNWRYILNNGKEYFSGEVIYNGKKKGVYLHRYLFNLENPKYRHWYIDHLNSDGLNNTRNNLVITDAQGNSINKIGKGYTKHKHLYQSQIVVFENKYVKHFKTEKEAIQWVKCIKEEAMRQRLQFHSRAELDTYLKQKELVQAI